MSNSIKIEICAGSIESAIAANKGGADRIELCSALSEGGITPSAGIIEYVCDNLTIPVFVLIRPRTGDFHYTRADYEAMKKDILFAKRNGAKGIVTGMLNTDGTVDTCRMKDLIEMASPMEVTFHRAFDMSRNPFEALEEIINLKCHRILTSGQANNAIEGADLLSELVKIAGQRIIIMPGSGINLSNFNDLAEKTRAAEFHLSATRPFKSRMSYMKADVSMAGKNSNESEIIQTDSDTVERICDLAKLKRI